MSITKILIPITMFAMLGILVSNNSVKTSSMNILSYKSNNSEIGGNITPNYSEKYEGNIKVMTFGYTSNSSSSSASTIQNNYISNYTNNDQDRIVNFYGNSRYINNTSYNGNYNSSSSSSSSYTSSSANSDNSSSSLGYRIMSLPGR